MNRYCLLLLLAGMAVSPARAQELSAQEVFKRVSPSVVVIEAKDFPKGKPSRVIASGSGVVVPSRKQDENLVATNCHLTDKEPAGVFWVRQGDNRGVGFPSGKDAERDLCLLSVLFPDGRSGKDGKLTYKKLPAARIASSQWLEVGTPVYAVGAPQGLELTLSDGLVSGIREYKGTEYIQTTAPISQGSSGGGLFDAQGRLVGITTMYLKDGQNLNFAVPAELISSVPRTRSSAVVDASGRAETVSEASGNTEEAPPRDRWWMFYRGNDGEISFDTKTVQREEGKVIVWTRWRFAKPETGGVVEEVSHDTYYCGNRQYSFDQAIWRNAKGKMVDSIQRKSYEIKIKGVVPGTIGEHKYEVACSEL